MTLKTEIRKEMTEVEYVLAIICNVCGAEFSEPGYTFEGFEGVRIKNTFGYGSRLFGDMTMLDMHICEECLDKLVKACVVQPEVTDNW